jgi:hypothetical protein
MEHEEQAERLGSELERLEEHSNEVGEQIEGARREWEAKEDDPAVPGAQPDQSDQLPEEGPGEQVHDDSGDSEVHESPGTPGEEETATGNPDAAGADEE